MKKLLLASVCAFLSVITLWSRDVNRDIDRQIGSLWKTSALKMDSRRLGAMYRMQNYMDSLSSREFAEYCAADAPRRREMEDGTVLRFYQAALEKLLREIPSTKVRQGTVVIWHLYNMGYVVKTPSVCFAVDLKHPQAADLVPYLDFLLITHRHNDHYTDALNAAMISAGKMVCSNWDSNDYVLMNLSDTRQVELSGVVVDTEITDHNETHRNFVITYLVDCGQDTNHTRIYFVGDSCDYTQLNPAGSVDIFIPHIHVGLDICKASQKIDPNWVLSSHILELGHDLTKWRWSYFTGLDVSHEAHRQNVFLPVWGEKLVYDAR